jgi:hypothetical protein
MKLRRQIGLTGAALAVACVLLTVPSPAQAKDGQVTVRAAGTTNASVTVKLADLGGNDINNRTYRLNSGSESISGHSLLQVIRAADAQSNAIDLDTIPGIEIDRPTGTPIEVSGAEMRDPEAFSDGPPVFYEDNGDTVFVMPGRGSGTGSKYRFKFAPVGISINSGLDYDVTLTASPSKIKAGASVRFQATVTGQETGEQLTYRWTFGDGQSKTTAVPTVRHRFEDDGTFPVIVTATGSSGSGRTGTTVEVGKPKPQKPKPDPERDKPDRKPASSDGTGGSGDPTGDGGYGTGSGTGDYGDGDGSGFPSASGSPAPAPQTPPRDRKPGNTQRPDDGLTTVTGELLNPATTPVPIDPAAGPAVESADPAPSGTDQGGFGVPGAVLTLAGVGLLLGLGGFAELRVFSRLY